MGDKFQILCYGDSNTWGCIGNWRPSDLPTKRFDPETRWPDVLQQKLGEKARVIAEGLGGRTTIYPVKGAPWKNGESYLLPCLRSHRPLELVVIMLGTNDLQTKRDMTVQQLGDGISRLIDIIQNDPMCGRGFKPPAILIISPIEVKSAAPEGRVEVYDNFRREIGAELSRQFPEVYSRIAREKGCHFLNGAEYAKPCDADGVHFDAESHVRLGNAVAEYIEKYIDFCPAPSCSVSQMMTEKAGE